MPRCVLRLKSSLLIVALATGCGENVTVPKQAAQSSAASAPAPPMAEGASGFAMSSDAARGRVRPLEQAVSATAATDASQPAAQPTDAALATGMVIRDGSASIQVDSLELGILAVQKLATSFGGYVGNTTLAAGENQVRSATLQLKIPSARYDEALTGMRSIGKVEAVTSTAQDVGEEFVDISARVANAKRLEERLVTLLATRTGKLEDVLAVERELARVREEIERYEGRIRFLKTRVATSTLSVTVHERMPLVSTAPGENVILDAFKDAWRNFVRFVAALIASMGVLIPLAALGVVVWVLRKRFMRRG